MKEEREQLNGLKKKINETWSLLNIDSLAAEMHALEKEMQDKDFWNDQKNATQVGKRHEEIKQEISVWSKMRDEVDELLSLCFDLEKNPDKEMAEDVKKKIAELGKEFLSKEFFLLLSGKHDKKNAIMAIHSGSGGTEAQDWAEMLFRMYMRFCESQGWQVSVLDESRGQEAGIKSIVLQISGRYVYGRLKSEHGTHRLVRISPFDAEKMRHTSFALVEVIPEMDETEVVKIDSKDLRIDTFMASGHGGQSVNTTYSAVRIVHVPTNITVTCQNERSQLQNRETALKILQSKLQKIKEEQEEEEKQKIRGEYKSPEWGSQIRSYVLHPYHLVKDLRSEYETTDDQGVLSGNLQPFIEAYLKWLKRNQT